MNVNTILTYSTKDHLGILMAACKLRGLTFDGHCVHSCQEVEEDFLCVQDNVGGCIFPRPIPPKTLSMCTRTVERGRISSMHQIRHYISKHKHRSRFHSNLLLSILPRW